MNELTNFSLKERNSFLSLNFHGADHLINHANLSKSSVHLIKYSDEKSIKCLLNDEQFLLLKFDELLVIIKMEINCTSSSVSITVLFEHADYQVLFIFIAIISFIR